MSLRQIILCILMTVVIVLTEGLSPCECGLLLSAIRWMMRTNERHLLKKPITCINPKKKDEKGFCFFNDNVILYDVVCGKFF